MNASKLESLHSSKSAANRRDGEIKCSPLEMYFVDISEPTLLSWEQEQELGRQIQEGNMSARDQLIEANLRLVVHIAREFVARGLDLPDLIGEGNLGLLRAAETFDPDRQTRFSTYASFWIKQSTHRALQNQASPVRLPVYTFHLLSKHRRATERLKAELGRVPTFEEVSERMRLSRRKQAIIRKAMEIHTAAGQPADELPDPRRNDASGPSLSCPTQSGTHLDQLLESLDQLDERNAAVLRMRFGLGGEEPKTLHEIGDRLSLTRERVRQIERSALNLLRDAMRAG